MIARTLMIQGTGSSAGKSLLVAALCRIFARRGIRVAPFKAQNMSNNAAVCADGAEIGRSQALQAAAAGILPESDINPILLKPEADTRSQILVNGRIWKTLAARCYYRSRAELWPVVTEALDRLRKRYELIIIEGAGSPAELNLHATEIVNMAVARYARSPVVLVGDIERGGVFAQLLGTLWLLENKDRALIRGLLVNKFRGDPALFAHGARMLEKRGGVPVLGIIPWLHDLKLPEEDAAVLSDSSGECRSANNLDIAVIRLPHIANFDDFDPLAAEPGVALRYVESTATLGRPDAIILPGTKSTIADLIWLRETELAKAIEKLAEQGATVIGICGGYQMLGRSIRDPEQVESTIGEIAGLGLLAIDTVFTITKDTRQVRASVQCDHHCPGCRGAFLTGYEIHMARTRGDHPWLRTLEPNDHDSAKADGAVSEDGRIWGCYLHGLFHNNDFRRAWLRQLRRLQPHAFVKDDNPSSEAEAANWSACIDQSLNRLADTVESAVEMRQVENIIWGATPGQR